MSKPRRDKKMTIVIDCTTRGKLDELCRAIQKTKDINKAAAEVKNSEKFWTVGLDSGLVDMACATKEEAEGIAQEDFANECESEGETRENYAELVQFFYDDDGEQIIIDREEITLSYEGYHGDHAEHFCQSNFI